MYSPARTVAEAVAECASLSGRQFLPLAAEALKAVSATGALDAWARSGDFSEVAAALPAGDVELGTATIL